jgi:hypothetical protein
MEAHKIQFLGTREFRDEAQALVAAPGDAVLVERGVPRALVIKCPDGCGDILLINLDRRSGKAWRLNRTADDKLSLYPSVAKQGGCESHFVVRRSEIIWCADEEEVAPAKPVAPAKSSSPALSNSVQFSLPSGVEVNQAANTPSSLWSRALKMLSRGLAAARSRRP